MKAKRYTWFSLTTYVYKKKPLVTTSLLFSIAFYNELIVGHLWETKAQLQDLQNK